MTPEQEQQARIDHFQVQDKMPKVRRMFVNEYGTDAYMRWKALIRTNNAMSLRDFEKALRKSMSLSATSPVVDEYEKANP